MIEITKTNVNSKDIKAMLKSRLPIVTTLKGEFRSTRVGACYKYCMFLTALYDKYTWANMVMEHYDDFESPIAAIEFAIAHGADDFGPVYILEDETEFIKFLRTEMLHRNLDDEKEIQEHE